MALYAIGDLHLSFGSNKPMDIFGKQWDNHAQKLVDGFSEVGEEDTTVICGDLSWAMNMEKAKEDFLFIHSLPGKKIILKGNHDYWWSTASKAMAAFRQWGIDSISILHNNCFPFGENAAICGTRGWFFEEETGSEHDKKIMLREIGRLETSLKAAGEREKYVFLHYPPKYGEYECPEILELLERYDAKLHYPPKYGEYECPEILELLERYDAKLCAAGHIHGPGLRWVFEGQWQKTEHLMVAADHIDFKPRKILA